MNATANESAAPSNDAAVEHFLVSHGKSGGVGNFGAMAPLQFRRGDRVVIDSSRGREVGTVLCPTSAKASNNFGSISSGKIVRPLDSADELILQQSLSLQERLFDASRKLALAQTLAIEILDVDVLLENRAILQFVGVTEAPMDAFVETLSQSFHIDIRLENLALPAQPLEAHGCGKPDCGRTANGGCSTCDTGGGCSSCGSGGVDLRQYFAHLRTQMEAKNRTPLL